MLDRADQKARRVPYSLRALETHAPFPCSQFSKLLTAREPSKKTARLQFVNADQQFSFQVRGVIIPREADVFMAELPEIKLPSVAVPEALVEKPIETLG